MAHTDSWLLFTILLGCYLIDHNDSQFKLLIGVIIVTVSFWFKQYGAIFALGAVLYITWRDGWRKSILYWIVAAIIGPGIYLAAPDWLLGPRLHYFTFEIPRQWMQFDINFTIIRVIKYIVKYYFWLFAVAILSTIFVWIRNKKIISIWGFLLPLAIFSGFYVALDPGNLFNVFIPMSAWIIITGVIGLNILIKKFPKIENIGLAIFILSASYALVIYNPFLELVSNKAEMAYVDLVDYLKLLPGPVYAPYIGQLESDYEFYPAVDNIPMVDLFRNPSWDLDNNPITRTLLSSVINPVGNAYILQNIPLEDDPSLGFLTKYYVLEVDFMDRFSPLNGLPREIGTGYPRLLYRYQPH